MTGTAPRRCFDMKLRILFCGFRHGHINSLYKKVAQSDIACVAGCFEEDSTARDAARLSLGAEFSERSYDEWLKDEGVDAVAIGLAYGDRGEAVIKALEAGKHVIADKPLCTSLSQLDRIARLAADKGLRVGCMLDLRYLPQTLRAKELLSSGELGEIRNVSFNGQHCLNYGTRPSWYFEEGKHGGTVNDLAIHGIDLVRMLTGEEFARTDGVRLWNSYATEEKAFKDSAVFMARLGNGAEVMADVSYSAPSQVFSMPTYWEFRFWCDKGLLTFNYVNNTVTVYKDGEDTAVYEGSESRGEHLEEFVKEINEGGRAMTENTLASTRAALLIQAEADRIAGGENEI